MLKPSKYLEFLIKTSYRRYDIRVVGAGSYIRRVKLGGNSYRWIYTKG